MTWSSYASFVLLATLLVLVPGPDVAVVVRNTLVGGRPRGSWTAAGVSTAGAVQGLAAAAGLGAALVRAQPVFQAVRWIGLAYLIVLAAQALRTAVHADYPPLDVAQPGSAAASRVARAGWRQGFLCNITNPKVLVFYLAVLPQFISPHAPLHALLALALSHAGIGLAYLLLLVRAMHRVRGWLGRRPVRRALDGLTGLVLLAFAARLALD